MKSDTQLRDDIVAELEWDPAINANQIGVAVKDGVVSLSGHIDSYAEKWAVEKALNRIQGVRAAALELDVRLSPDHKRGDTDIAKAAQWALEWHSQVPPDAVRVTVDKGWLTLQGEVEWSFQRDSAIKAVRNLKGVLGVSSEITLKKKPMRSDLKQRIRDALTRQAVREANHLSVDIQGDEVTLRGRVHSLREREAARGAAWSAPGVGLIIDDMTVE
ncbi:MAG: BON domain-containing protein [Paucibacter sp.]|nr:BON domain-containing protein [Roseateles sp.]